MTSDAFEGLKIPTRPAPPPPKTVDNTNSLARRNTTFVASGIPRPSNDISSRAERFTFQSVPRSRSTSDISGGRRKPAPPRPPPPRLPPITALPNAQTKYQSIKIKLPGFKSRKKHQQSNKPHVHVWRAPSNKSHPLVGSLIDLQSPPKSPFNNNGSSSDDSSVDSFDSDSGGPSSTDNQNEYSNGWNGSQVESGFEDDFDRISTPSSCDPWSDSKSDPFSPQRRNAPSFLVAASGNNKFDISNDDPKSKKHILSSPSISRPTVIRPSIPILESKSGLMSSFKNDDDDLVEGSPPMPSMPPPPPPPEALEVLAHGPPLPARPAKSYEPSKEEAEKPYCIALYDYFGDVAEDLCFKVNDVIILKRRVNEEWLEGEVNGKTGIFPVCFVDIKVSLNGNNDVDYNKIVITLFDYEAQTWDDLDIKEGDLIRVIGEVDENWLYGECNGKRGQFPKNYTAEYSLN